MNKKEINEKIFEEMMRTFIFMRHSMNTHHPRFEDGGLQRGQGKILKILAEKQEMPQRELVDILDIKPSSLSELLSKLEKKGYIKKEQNGRSFDICITKKGKDFVEKMTDETDDDLAEYFIGINEEEKQQLFEILQKLNRELEENLSKSGVHRHHGPFSHRFFHR